jgi:pimeloyl-ACP methyl ester carboxylesterase
MARSAFAVLALLGGIFAILSGCTTKPDRGQALGASVQTITTSDGILLDARLWTLDPERIVIYLHEYREDQTSWWGRLLRHEIEPVSGLTFDFRGHGDSEGAPDDVAGMWLDVDAAIAFARERGFQQILLVGAGMGAAAAMIAAVQEPSIAVVGLSAPSDFDLLEPLAAAPALKGRLALAAGRDDLSAAYSLEQFREIASLSPAHSPLYAGRTHGVEMLDGRAGADVRAYVDRFMTRFWRGELTER